MKLKQDFIIDLLGKGEEEVRLEIPPNSLRGRTKSVQLKLRVETVES